MPRYQVCFQREVTVTETVERIIEAETEEAAMELAEGLAEEYNRDCPDDTVDVADSECHNWTVTCAFPYSGDEPVDVEQG